ncbi:hypothetical protein KIW84_075476 [Lathyrus oleraceus]|uniref:Protein FAR1-RELATED SEQUENCE n=1 Tax=Pisum sativum TaxID=3888 RepID=A0A9D4VWJ7_PEA|nr:hypothetical protein KIW84_075476 [Pisum sativum]
MLTTHLHLIESDAAKIDTTEVFKEVKDEIMKAGAMIVKNRFARGDTEIYTLKKYCWDKYEREVVYDGTTRQCSCRIFDSRGLPCSHMFYVMKEEHVDHIPTSLVLLRWTKDAKIEYLNLNCNILVDSYLIEQSRVDDPIGTAKSDVGDSTTAKSKCAPKKEKKSDTKAVRRCSKCNRITHNARTCSHFPANVVEDWLLPNQTDINVVDLHKNVVYPCVLKRGRKPREKYLCLGWYEYVKPTRLRPGDVLVCTMADPPTTMFVCFLM